MGVLGPIVHERNQQSRGSRFLPRRRRSVLDCCQERAGPASAAAARRATGSAQTTRPSWRSAPRTAAPFRRPRGSLRKVEPRKRILNWKSSLFFFPLSISYLLQKACSLFNVTFIRGVLAEGQKGPRGLVPCLVQRGLELCRGTGFDQPGRGRQRAAHPE